MMSDSGGCHHRTFPLPTLSTKPNLMDQKRKEKKGPSVVHAGSRPFNLKMRPTQKNSAKSEMGSISSQPFQDMLWEK